MERKWGFNRKNPNWLNKEEQNWEACEEESAVQQEASAKIALLRVAESDQLTFEEIAPLHQWLKAESRSLVRLTPAAPRTPIARSTLHCSPSPPTPVHSVIPLLKQQLQKLESPLPLPRHPQPRRTHVPAVRRKYDLVLFEQVLRDCRRSVRVKNTPLPRHSAKDNSHPPADPKRRLVSRQPSCLALRAQGVQGQERQARRERTLNSLLQ